MKVDTKKLREMYERQFALHVMAISPGDLKTLLDALDAATRALDKINVIRNSIVGRQVVNWSGHIYPLVAALGEAGYDGEGYEVARVKAEAEIAAFSADYNSVVAKLAAAEERASAAERERDEARDWMRRMHRDTQVLTCVYCGESYPPGTSASGSDALTAHIQQCKKHPLANERAARLAAEADASALRVALEPFSRVGAVIYLGAGHPSSINISGIKRALAVNAGRLILDALDEVKKALQHERHYRLVDQDETEHYDFEPTCAKCVALAKLDEALR